MYDLTLWSGRIFEMFLPTRKIRIAGANNTRTDQRLIYSFTIFKKKNPHGFDFWGQRITSVLQTTPRRGVELFFFLSLSRCLSWRDRVENNGKGTRMRGARSPGGSAIASQKVVVRLFLLTHGQLIVRRQYKDSKTQPRLLLFPFFPLLLVELGGVATAGRIIRCAWIYNLE